MCSAYGNATGRGTIKRGATAVAVLVVTCDVVIICFALFILLNCCYGTYIALYACRPHSCRGILYEEINKTKYKSDCVCARSRTYTSVWPVDLCAIQFIAKASRLEDAI